MERDKTGKKTIRSKMVVYSIILLLFSLTSIVLATYFVSTWLMLDSTQSLNDDRLNILNENISEILLGTDNAYKLINNNKTFIDSITKFSNRNKESDDSSQDYLLLNKVIQPVIVGIKQYNKSILTDMLVVTNSKVFTEGVTIGNYITITNEEKLIQFMTELKVEDTLLMPMDLNKIPGIGSQSGYFQGTNSLILIKSLYDSHNRETGKVIFLLNEDKTNMIIRNPNLLILNEKNNLIFDGIEKDQQFSTHVKNAFEAVQGNDGTFRMEDGNEEFLVAYKSEKNYKIINVYSIDIFYKGLSKIRVYSVYVGIGALLVMLLLIYSLSRNLSTGLVNIVRAFNSVATDKTSLSLYQHRKTITEKAFHKFSYSTKLMAFFILSILIPISAVSAISYTSSRKSMNEQVTTLINETLNLSINNLTGVINNCIYSSVYIATNSSFQEYLKQGIGTGDYDRITGILNIIMNNTLINKNYLYEISLYNTNNQKIYSNTNFISSDEDDNSILHSEANRSGNMFWSFNSSYDSNVGKHFILFRRQCYDAYGNYIGALKIKFEERLLANIVNKNNILNDFYITDENSIIVSALQVSQIGTKLNLSAGQESPQKNSYIIEKSLSNPKWKVFASYREEKLSQGYMVLLAVYIFHFLICIIMVILFSHRLSFLILEPVTGIAGAFNNLEILDFSIRYSRIKGDELDYLADGFNRMVQRLNELIQEVYEVRIHEKELELNTLQSQINPHFLYNTLETVIAMVDLGDERACDMLVLLSHFFRKGINRGQLIVKIKDEIEYTKIYIDIQSIRYNDKLNVIWDYDEKYEDYLSINMLLQPLIENSLKHGIESSLHPGRVKIKIYKAAGKLKFAVSDNGIGISRDELIKLRKVINGEIISESIGIKNVHDRIQLYFGPDYGIQVFSKQNKGTIVVASLPLSMEANSQATR